MIRPRQQQGQALTEYALLVGALVAATVVAAGPMGFLDGWNRYFASIYFVLSLPVP